VVKLGLDSVVVVVGLLVKTEFRFVRRYAVAGLRLVRRSVLAGWLNL
jgi:hypothetical protein